MKLWRTGLLLVAGMLAWVGMAVGATEEGGKLAAEILRAARVDAGFCVHLGCGDGRLTAELCRGRNVLVHGLSADPQAAAAARRHIQAEGLYGQASAQCSPLARLPYADGLANLVVAEGLPALLKAGLAPGEIGRVLCPGGVAVVRAGTTRIEGLEPAGGSGEWAAFRKPRTQGMDDWTHRAYDASGNCVSHDTALGPLATLRWLAGPIWPMGTGYQVSNGGLLAAGGRVFNVTMNELSNAGRIPQTRNNTWFLTARDAYSGLLLWSRPVERRMLRDGQELGNSVVATRERLYAVLGTDLAVLDPATGRTLATCARDASPRTTLALADGTLLLAGAKAVRAFGAADGTLRWRHPVNAQDIVSDAGLVFLTTNRQAEMQCLDLASGSLRWKADIASIKGKKKRLLLSGAGVAVVVWELDWQKGHNGIAAFASADGRELWRVRYESSRATWPDTVWLVDGLLRHRVGKAGVATLDPLTGQRKGEIVLRGGYCGGCVRNIATEEYLVSTRPLNLLDWRDGTAHGFRGGRHPCRAGVVVANGMLYSQPHGCKCVRESLRGFLAFAPGGAAPPAEQRLVRGPAAGAELTGSGAAEPTQWPTFRHDARRSGSTPAAVGTGLRLLWQTRVADQAMPPAPLADEWLAHPLGGDRITAPVADGDAVYVALVDAHRVVALDAASGKTRWSFTAGGRVDTPPTLYRGLCLFGCYDGWVYCLRASDGVLVWRYRAAPREQRIVAFGQIESSWPVVGGVLIENGIAHCVAGRSSAVDGGITGHALRPRTGEVVWTRPMAGAVSDLLVSDGDALRMAGGASGGLRFDAQKGERLRRSLSAGFNWSYDGKVKTLWGGPNRVLDRSWHTLSINDTASHWMRIKQGYGPHQGHLLVASPDGARIVGFRFKYIHWSKVKDPETEFGGELVAWEGGKVVWKVDVPADFQVEALVLAGDVVFAAGPTDRFRRTPGGRLWVLSARDGTLLERHELASPPAADGLAATPGHLYGTTHDGHVLCFISR